MHILNSEHTIQFITLLASVESGWTSYIENKIKKKFNEEIFKRWITKKTGKSLHCFRCLWRLPHQLLWRYLISPETGDLFSVAHCL